MRVAVSRCAEACGGCTVLAQIIRESPFTGRIVRDGLLPFPCDPARQFLRLVCFRFSHQPSVCKSEGFLRQQLKRLENRAQPDDISLVMKSQLLFTTIAAVVLVGCGPSIADLTKAVRDGNTEAVKQFIANGVDVNAKDDNGWTPLYWSADKGHKEIAELLITAGADVNAKGRSGRTPLDRAVSKRFFSDDKKETADLLRKHGGKTAKELKAEGK